VRLGDDLAAAVPFYGGATPERYNEAAATLAWNRMVDWFNTYTR